jgi:PilZ domain
MDVSDRRTHTRFPFSSRLEVRQRRSGRTPSGEDVERVARAIAVDVSVGGLGFQSALPLAIGDLISVSLPYSDVASAHGLGERSTTMRAGADPVLEVQAIVRHVKREGDSYVIGAERRADA